MYYVCFKTSYTLYHTERKWKWIEEYDDMDVKSKTKQFEILKNFLIPRLMRMTVLSICSS